MIANDSVLHGYTARDLRWLAAYVVFRWGHRWPRSDKQDMRDIAWEAIAEALCSAMERPSSTELMDAGSAALHAEMRAQASSHGITRHANGAGKNFERYWLWHAFPTRSPELEIIERIAVQQILPVIAPMPRRALLVLAETGDYTQACKALKVSPDILIRWLGEGREQFARLWHENVTVQFPGQVGRESW